MSDVISIAAIVVSSCVLVFSVGSSIVRGERVFPSKDQLRRFLKFMIFDEYEPPKRSK